jgi:hypothetical protein
MFQRIDAKHAGPDTLGILIPPGLRTLVVLRPRALDWDLLPARWDGNHANAPAFCTFSRDEAAKIARQLMEELESAPDNPLGTFGNADGTCVQIWLQTKDFVWVVCRRAPGRGYEPMIFSSQELAVADAEKLAAVFWPPADRIQTYYFNTQGFH